VVDGAVLGITIGETKYVYFGGPFLVLSAISSDCDDLDFLKRSYEIGNAPTPYDMAFLQFAWNADAVDEGRKAIDRAASVGAAVLDIQSDGSFEFDYATGGVITVEELVEEKRLVGDFEGVAFLEGTLTGTFEAEWCRNLKAP